MLLTVHRCMTALLTCAREHSVHRLYLLCLAYEPTLMLTQTILSQHSAYVDLPHASQPRLAGLPL